MNTKSLKQKATFESLNDKFVYYVEIMDAFTELFVSIDAFSSMLPQKFYKSILKDITDNYEKTIKRLSFNEKFETKVYLKKERLARKDERLSYKFFKKQAKIKWHFEKMKYKLSLLPSKLELTKSKVEYEKASWVYFGQKIKLWFKTWFSFNKTKKEKNQSSIIVEDNSKPKTKTK